MDTYMNKYWYIYSMDKKYVVYTISYQGVVKYVGKTCDFDRRKRNHLTYRGNRRHSSIPIEVNLVDVEILPIKKFNNEEEALKYEDELIIKYDTINSGWNKYRSGLIKASDKNEYTRLQMITYRKEHHEEFRKVQNINQRKHYQEHREEECERNRKRYKKKMETNREEYNAHKRNWYQEHKEERRKYAREWARTHKKTADQ